MSLSVEVIESRFKADLSTKRSPMDRPSGYLDWLNKAIRHKAHPDNVRNYLYYGFQPLFDVLVEGEIGKEVRAQAVRALEIITGFTADYLSGYFTGDDLPDVSMLEPLRENMQTLVDAKTPWRTKERNIGLYDGQLDGSCRPKQIQRFVKNTMLNVGAGTIPAPDYIIGCACGSSEIALIMARMFAVKYDFIRQSKRREDESPRIVTEHLDRMKRRAAHKTVYVIEDFVCTGRSISKVMDYAQKNLKAEKVLGLAMNTNGDPKGLKQVLVMEESNVYEKRT